MPTSRVQLLLLESVENLGIVGDVVKVKPGYARNYLFPQGMAEVPSEEKIEALKEARAKALAAQQAKRKAQEQTLEKMHEMEISLVRSANDQGLLYGSVTQRDIIDALAEQGYHVEFRAIRLAQPIRRVGEYHVLVQFAKDLRGDITINVSSDRPIDEIEERDREAAQERVESEAEADEKAKASAKA